MRCTLIHKRKLSYCGIQGLFKDVFLSKRNDPQGVTALQQHTLSCLIILCIYIRNEARRNCSNDVMVFKGYEISVHFF